MERATLDYGLKLKAVDTAGTFEGHASVFGNVDDGGDIVMPGAFVASLVKHRQQGTAPLLLWQHDPDYPIGTLDDLAEDAKGLYVKGSLLKGVQRAEEAHILLKAGAIRGMSFAYDPIDVELDGNARRLKTLDLYEVSIVSFPMNRRARVENVKAQQQWGRLEAFAKSLRDGEPPAIKDFEGILRDAGVPKSMAVQIASAGYANVFRSESGNDQEAKAAIGAAEKAVAALRSLVSGS
jgi:HK97 family phage prohead protease